MIDALAPINPAVSSPGQSCSKAGFLRPAAVFASRFEAFRFERTSFHPAAVFSPNRPLDSNRSPPSSGPLVFHKRANDQNRPSPLLRHQRGLKNFCWSFFFFCDSFQEIAFGLRFYFNFAHIYLAHAGK